MIMADNGFRILNPSYDVLPRHHRQPATIIASVKPSDLQCSVMSMLTPLRHRWSFSLRTLFAVAAGVAVAIVAGPIGVLVLLYLGFFASLRFSSKRLPAVVTTTQGRRVSRQVYLSSMLFVGLWGPLFPTGLILACLAKELTASTMTNLAWVVCVLLAIVIAAHWKTVSVNPQAATQ